MGSTVDAVMEEEAQEPLLRPRRGLFSRKRLVETEELYAPPEPEEAPEEIPEIDTIGPEPELAGGGGGLPGGGQAAQAALSWRRH